MSLRVGTLFSGIGSPEEALKNLNIDHEIIFASDISKSAKKTYFFNHNPKKFYNDILEIPKNIEQIDLLIFGAPCQPFSIASSKRNGLNDKRGQLFLEACKILKNSNPKYFIIENVKNLLKIDNGKTFNIIINKLKKYNYNIFYKVLNSLDHGVPQKRERVYIVGIRKDIVPNFNFNFNFKKKKYKSLSDILDKNVDKRYYATKSFLQKDKVKLFLKKYKHDYSPCLTQTIARNGSSSEYISYVSAVYKATGECRKPTPRECARMHGFCENFRFPNDVSITDQYKQMANTMTVPVIEDILRKLLYE